MLALLSHLETPASHWFRYVDDTWLKLKSKDMLALTSLKTLKTDLVKLSPVVQMILKVTHILLFKNNVYTCMCLFLTYLQVQISQDTRGKCAFHFVI